MTDGFEAQYWTLLQGLAWVFLGDPALVSRCGTAAPDRRFGQEQILSDGTKIVSLTSPGPPSTITIDVAAAARGAGASATTVTTVGAENEPRLPEGVRPVVPAAASKQFETAEFQTSEAAQSEILRCFRSGELPISGRRRGRGPREVIPVLERVDIELDWDHGCGWGKGPGQQWDDLCGERAAWLRLWPGPILVTESSGAAAAETARQKHGPVLPPGRRGERPTTQAAHLAILRYVEDFGIDKIISARDFALRATEYALDLGLEGADLLEPENTTFRKIAGDALVALRVSRSGRREDGLTECN
jgi:hypothetical protein